VRRPDDDARAALWTIDGESLLLKITDAGLRAVGVAPEPAARPAAADTAPTDGEESAPRGGGAHAPGPAQGAPTPAPRAGLRDAAAAVLAAWEDEASRTTDIVGALDGPMQALRAALAGKPAARTPRGGTAARPDAAPRKPRGGTKQEAVLALLRRPEGATVAQIAEATGWAPHTVRGFFAGLKKKGVAVEAAERVRQVGPNKEGARGSFTIYKVAG
jgi:hypothetical protein